MTKPPGSRKGSRPPRYPTPAHTADGNNFAPHIFQAVVKMQRSLGALEQAAKDLGRRVDDQSNTLGRIEKTIIGVTAAITAVIAASLWFIDTFKDAIVEALAKIAH